MRAVGLIAILLGGLAVRPTAAQPKTAVPTPQVRLAALPAIPDEAVRQNARLAASLSPSAKRKVVSAAAGLDAAAKQQPGMTEAQLQDKARASVVQAFPKLNGMDVDAVVFLVMMESAQDQQADLQQMMNAMQNTKSKQGVRGTQEGSLDQMNEMSEEEQMRLQMAMDRESKFYDTLSNLMKKIADTQASIIANLK